MNCTQSLCEPFMFEGAHVLDFNRRDARHDDDECVLRSARAWECDDCSMDLGWENVEVELEVSQ